MATEFLGDLVLMEYSTDGGTTYKTIVCEEGSEGGSDGQVNETPTKCATFTAPGTVTTTLSGTGVVDAAPGGTQATFEDVHALVLNKTKVTFRYQNAVQASPSIGVGTAIYMQGMGYFTSARTQNNVGEVSKFSWSFSATGTVDVTV